MKVRLGELAHLALPGRKEKKMVKKTECHEKVYVGMCQTFSMRCKLKEL